MASTPFFFSGLLFLAWFTADVHSVKVLPDMLEGSSVVLSPDKSVTSITAITWKHGDNLAVDWNGGDKTFYNIFNNTCSLNTTTGELTIHNVRLEHSGVYTPDINGKTRSAMKLRVLLKVLPDVLEGSSVVLRPDKSVTSITAITWKHGDKVAADWFEGNKAFYNIFSGTCSLNTETGELTINNVTLEHSGVYRPDINGKTRSALKLRVFSKVIDMLEGSSVVLSPDKSVMPIIAITWKHGDNLAADWNGGNKAFYNIFNNTCSLNTTTGELTIHNVTLEHSGVYRPDINGKTRSALKLRVLSKVIDMLEGSSVVLSPDESVMPIIAITWKHGDNLAADWNGGDKAFYIFSDTCSLNTTTGQLTINNVRPEHSGVYTPDINGRTRSAMKLRVLSPVPKTSISHDCYPGETLTCTLRCMHAYTPENVGHMEVSWILDDRHREKGPELQITEDTKTETFICSLNNSVSSENSTKLQNPFLPGVPVWKPVIGTLVPLVSLALSALVCWKWIYPKYRRDRINREIRETKMFEEHDRILAELRAAGSVPDRDQGLLDFDKVILRILRQGNKRNLSEDSILMLLTARYVILRKLRQGPEVQNSLENVKKIMEKFFKGRHDLWLLEDVKPTLHHVNVMISKILNKSKELQLSKEEDQALQDADKVIFRTPREGNKRNLSADEVKKLQDAHEVILGILKEGYETNLSADEVKKLLDAHEVILGILKEGNETNLSADEVKKLLDAHEVILGILKEGNERNLSADKQSHLNEKGQGSLNAASNDTSRPRDPAADPLISSSRFEVVDPV